MKTLFSATLILLVAAVPVPAQYAQSSTTYAAGTGSAGLVPGAVDYAVVQQGPDSRVWARVDLSTNESGQVSMQTNSYVELQTGMAYLTNGNYVESQEIIEGFRGGAVARQGQIQMIFPNDISVEPIDAQTPAGRFRSAVVCLSYADYSLQTNLIIAEVQSCQGQIIAANQVLYPGAFSNNVSASVRYTYRKYGWEQDILIEDPGTLPIPESMGLDSSSSTLMLQVITEFLDAPAPGLTSQAGTAADGLTVENDQVDWGAIRLGQGQALFLGLPANAKAVATGKRWVVTSDNRQFLVEEVPFARLLRAILNKNNGAMIDNSAIKIRPLGSLDSLPKLRPAKPNLRRMEMAAVRPRERGLLIDYVTMASSTNNYVFQSDSTYYISGLVSLSGTTVCEGDTVIKFTNYPTAKISMSGPLVCQTAQYRPVVMTSKDDNTVGQAIGGSTGSPTNYNGATYLEDNNLQNNTYQGLRLLYAGTGLSAANFSNGVWHCQFVKCGTAVNATNTGPVVLRNVLIAQCTNAVVTSGTLSAEHLTADQCTTLLSGAGSSGNLTNCLITAVPTLGSVSLYNSANPSSGTGVYQPVGAASYYLADTSTNRNAGTTNINSGLLAALTKRTTYPPILLTSNFTVDTVLSPQAQRDTDTPDRGYEYDPLDYVVSGRTLSATLSLSNGVVLGTYGTSAGISISSGQFVSQGLANHLNYIVRYNTVQEQSTTNWSSSSVGDEVGQGSSGSAKCNFSGWSVLAGTGNHFNCTSDSTLSSFNHCQFSGGKFTISRGLVGLTNCLWERIALTFNDLDAAANQWYCYNNLFRGGSFWYKMVGASPVALAYDNLFDQTTITKWSGSDLFTNGYNAYVTNYSKLAGSSGNDKVLTNSPVYQTSWLGSYYYPTNDGMLSTLINFGSRTADIAGLYHFTTTTNQVAETNSTVDIGYHYVATDGNGNPLDANGDGIPDYLSDSNGNGTVDSGEIGWNITGDLGLKVIITRPRNGAILLP